MYKNFEQKACPDAIASGGCTFKCINSLEKNPIEEAIAAENAAYEEKIKLFHAFQELEGVTFACGQKIGSYMTHNDDLWTYLKCDRYDIHFTGRECDTRLVVGECRKKCLIKKIFDTGK